MTQKEENLTKIHVDLPNHPRCGGESIWAKDLGGDLYELRNVPFFAYGLNFLDVVRATADNPELKPEIRSVVRRGGHRTLRIIFDKIISQEDQKKHLEDLCQLDVSYERADDQYVCIDVHSTSDYQVVCNRLWALEQTGVLTYETCEEQVAGSFDARPIRSN